MNIEKFIAAFKQVFELTFVFFLVIQAYYFLMHVTFNFQFNFACGIYSKSTFFIKAFIFNKIGKQFICKLFIQYFILCILVSLVTIDCFVFESVFNSYLT